MRFPLRVDNPHLFGIALERLELLLDGSPVISNAAGVVRVGAREAADIDLDVLLPLTQTPALMGQLWGLLTGTPLAYRLEGDFLIEGLNVRLPSRTLASGSLTLAAVPSLRLNLARTRWQREGFTAILEVGLDAHNPSALPYSLEVLGVGLYAAERRLAWVELEPVTLRPNGVTPLTLRFRLSGRAVGVQFFRPTRGLELRGETLLTLPMFGTVRLPLALALP